MTEPGWRRTKDPMYKCVPPKRWISAPLARASGMGDKGFCEDPIEIKVVSKRTAAQPCKSLADILEQYKGRKRNSPKSK